MTGNLGGRRYRDLCDWTWLKPGQLSSTFPRLTFGNINWPDRATPKGAPDRSEKPGNTTSFGVNNLDIIFACGLVA
jgi:hypothetical protein